MKQTNIYVAMVLEGKGMEKTQKPIQSYECKNFANFGKGRNVQMQEAQKTHNRFDQHRFSLKHIIIKTIRSIKGNSKDSKENS